MSNANAPGDLVPVFDKKAFRKVRHKLDLSLNDVGSVAGVTRQAVYHWESGKGAPAAGDVLLICRSWPEFRQAMAVQKLEIGEHNETNNT